MGNLALIGELSTTVADYQLSTWVLACVSLFLVCILAALAFYCTRKDIDDDDEF